MRPLPTASLAVLALAALLARLCPSAEPQPSLPYDLAKVRGIEHFPQDPVLRSVLSRNGFAVVQSSHPQVFSPYLRSSLPPLITFESAARTYQALLEGGFRLLEQAQARRLLRLSRRLLAALQGLEVEDVDLGRAHSKLLAWAAVGLRLQDEGADLAALPEEVCRLVALELEKVAAGRPATSYLYARDESFLYGHLKPTGFYEKDPALGAYFRAAKWYGLTSFRARDEGEVAYALLLAAAALRDRDLLRLLEEIGTPLDDLLGPPDDITLHKAAEVLGKLVEGSDGALEGARLKGVLPRFTGALAALPLPRINDQVLAPGVSSQGVRLLAPRYTWEGELVTKLGVGARPLHVLVALGGERAASIATREGGPEKAERARSVGRKLFDQAPSAAYPASIEAIEHVLRSAPPGAPPFAHTEAWRSYCTWAALGSWICLHHSWELHAKEVVNIYGSSQRPAGYVVPCPEAFEKLGAAAVLSSRVLERSGAFENDPGAQGPAGRAGAQMPGAVLVKEAFDDFVALMEDLARVSRKQIANDDLTVEERRTVAHYGNRLGRLHLYPGDTCFQPEDDLPLAVLFSTENPGLSPLIERYAAIGRAMDVYAIRNTPGEETRWIGRRTLIPAGLQLYHGATLSVYELERPATGERLTGVTWKALLDSKDAPALLRWASDFAARLATVTPRAAVR